MGRLLGVVFRVKTAKKRFTVFRYALESGQRFFSLLKE